MGLMSHTAGYILIAIGFCAVGMLLDQHVTMVCRNLFNTYCTYSIH
jgi:hypothetical protein